MIFKRLSGWSDRIVGLKPVSLDEGEYVIRNSPPLWYGKIFPISAAGRATLTNRRFRWELMTINGLSAALPFLFPRNIDLKREQIKYVEYSRILLSIRVVLNDHKSYRFSAAHAKPWLDEFERWLT